MHRVQDDGQGAARGGIEVILDVVFNHTAEGQRPRPDAHRSAASTTASTTCSDNRRRCYRNYSGCGNTVNCNHPVVRDLILDCLRYWVHDYARRRLPLRPGLGPRRATATGELLPNPPLIERIAEDPVLADTKLIAEPWDAAGAVSGRQLPGWGAGRSGTAASATTCAASGAAIPATGGAWPRGSPAAPICIEPAGGSRITRINFVTCHDGFTLATWSAYNRQAQPGQRRGEPRRRQRQLQLELRRRGPDAATAASTRCAGGRSRTSGDAAAWRRACR